MHKYRVVEHLGENGLCALQCTMGRYHLIRALGPMPGLALRLVGDKPHLGFGILRCTSSGAMYRVIFESINDRPPAPEPAQDRPHNPLSTERRVGLATAGRDD